jgi:hypothetical protein
MFKALKKFVAKEFGYKVRVFGGDHNGAVHYSLTFNDALSWMRCYPKSQRRAIYVTNWLGMIVAKVA